MQASKANRHDLYQQTVQTPKKDVKFMYNTYLDIFHHKPTTLREDFCGTAMLAVEWVKMDPSVRYATGVDIDEETVEWGRQNNVIASNVEDRSLRKNGIFVMDVCGGSEMIIPAKTVINYPNFKYTFEQKEFDPINNNQIIGIHFKFPDGSEIRDAFTFDWRLWSLPEFKECLEEAGFKQIRIWWSEVLPGMDSEFEEIVHKRPPQSDTWYAYIVGINS